MKRLLLPLLLPLLLASALAHAAPPPFYAGKALAHPAIDASQDSGADIAFLKEADGVNGYYCLCTQAGAKALLLDRFGNAVIRSVFYASLDRDATVQTLFVLFRRDGKDGLRAYRYSDGFGKYRRLDDLQPALDRIAAASKTPNAGQVKAALATLAPYDYSVVRGKSGNAQVDAIDHTQGTLIGYYDEAGKSAPAGDRDAVNYKKTFLKKGDHYLTASYTQDSDPEAGVLPNYRLWRVTWETAPQQFTGSEDGPAFIYSMGWSDGSVVERGQYVKGKRQGLWLRDDMREGTSKGQYVNGLLEGAWHFENERQVEDGVYRAGKREGRWNVTNYADADDVTGFDTYAGGEMNGPSERSMGGKLLSRGTYVKGLQQGAWITPDGDGSYVDGMRNGPWLLRLRNGVTQKVNFVRDKKQGELQEFDAQGKLRLRDHYASDVLEGERTRFMPSGAVVYTATFRNGQLDGREQAYDDKASGRVLRLDTLWINGRKNGLDARYYANGKPERLTVIEDGRLPTYLREYAEDGTLVNDIRRCNYKEYDSERTDVCDYHRMYYADGTPESNYVFQFGQRQEGRSYYKNGKVKDELLIDRDGDTSVWNTYYDSGQLKCTEPRRGHSKRTVNGQPYISYASASRDGDSICYHPNGKMASIRSYSKRLALDCGKQFDDAGKQTFPGPEGCPAPKKVMFNFGE